MTRLRFYCGSQIGQDKQVSNHERAEVERGLILEYGGFTRYQALGAWKDQREKTWVYEVLVDNDYNDFDLSYHRTVRDFLRSVLQQESVLLTVETVEAYF